MSMCYIHNRDDGFIECPDCRRESENKKYHNELLAAQREARKDEEFSRIMHENLQAVRDSEQNAQYQELHKQNQEIIELENKKIQLELERDVNESEAFNQGNKFDRNERYWLTEDGNLVILKVNPYIRPILKKSFEDGVLAYRNEFFPQNPGREYVLIKAKQLGESWNFSLTVTKITKSGAKFDLRIGVNRREYLDSEKAAPQGYVDTDNNFILMSTNDGELILSKPIFVDDGIAAAYCDGINRYMEKEGLNSAESKAARIFLYQSKIIKDSTNLRIAHEKSNALDAKAKAKDEAMSRRHDRTQAAGALSTGIVFLLIPAVWMFGGHDWNGFDEFCKYALGSAAIMFCYYLS